MRVGEGKPVGLDQGLHLSKIGLIAGFDKTNARCFSGKLFEGLFQAKRFGLMFGGQRPQAVLLEAVRFFLTDLAAFIVPAPFFAGGCHGIIPGAHLFADRVPAFQRDGLEGRQILFPPGQPGLPFLDQRIERIGNGVYYCRLICGGMLGRIFPLNCKQIQQSFPIPVAAQSVNGFGQLLIAGNSIKRVLVVDCVRVVGRYHAHAGLGQHFGTLPEVVHQSHRQSAGSVDSDLDFSAVRGFKGQLSVRLPAPVDFGRPCRGTQGGFGTGGLAFVRDHGRQ